MEVGLKERLQLCGHLRRLTVRLTTITSATAKPVVLALFRTTPRSSYNSVLSQPTSTAVSSLVMGVLVLILSSSLKQSTSRIDRCVKGVYLPLIHLFIL